MCEPLLQSSQCLENNICLQECHYINFIIFLPSTFTNLYLNKILLL